MSLFSTTFPNHNNNCAHAQNDQKEDPHFVRACRKIADVTSRVNFVLEPLFA